MAHQLVGFADIVDINDVANYIVCGYFTPDYKPLADKLSLNLNEIGVPHHLFAIEKVPGGWEANTMVKPELVFKAVRLYAERTVIFLDVDVEVRGDLSPLTKIKGEIAASIVTKRKKRGNPKMFVRTGTLVIQPIPAAHAFIEEWRNEAICGKRWDIDQTTFALTLSRSYNLTFQPLSDIWCAREGETQEVPVILQGSAGIATSSLKRFLNNLQQMVRPRMPTV